MTAISRQSRTPAIAETGQAPITVGIAPISSGKAWMGGYYYLHHLIRSVTEIASDVNARLVEVAWKVAPEEDPFAEVRDCLGPTRVIVPPQSLLRRGVRGMRKAFNDHSGAGDLFADKGIDAVFPRAPCADPGVPTAFWIPDFHFRRLPQYFTEQARGAFEARIGQSANLAKAIVVSSEDVLADMHCYLPQHADKARVLRFASVPQESWWISEPQDVANKFAISGEYVIVCNQFHRYKNHEVLIEAMAILRSRGHDLTLVCTGNTDPSVLDAAIDDARRRIAELGLEDSVRILGLIPRNEQIALVRGASILLQPSRLEGWSTIIEDARTLDRPVCASDIPVHREQLEGLDGDLLPLEDASAWADAIAARLGKAPRQLSFAEARSLSAPRVHAMGSKFVSIMREVATG